MYRSNSKNDRLIEITEKLEIKDMILNIAQDEAPIISIDRRLKKELGNVKEVQ